MTKREYKPESDAESVLWTTAIPSAYRLVMGLLDLVYRQRIESLMTRQSELLEPDLSSEEEDRIIKEIERDFGPELVQSAAMIRRSIATNASELLGGTRLQGPT